LTHWLALDVAAEALHDAGFADGQGLPRDTTGVLVGNTLTGEFSRAGTLRLRWPYVRRVLDARLRAEGWEEAQRLRFLTRSRRRTRRRSPRSTRRRSRAGSPTRSPGASATTSTWAAAASPSAAPAARRWWR